jgi:RNA polymerase sigma factor (sigma-70 family)
VSHEEDARDAELLARGEFVRLLAKYEPVIVGRCVAALRGSPDAEDVAQDVKLRLWREHNAGKSYPVPFRAVVHNVIGWTIGRYRQGKPTEAWPEDFDPADPSDAFGELVDHDAVASALDGLPDRAREVMELYYLAKLEIPAIAEHLGMKRNAVDQALHRGRKKLRETLDRG